MLSTATQQGSEFDPRTGVTSQLALSLSPALSSSSLAAFASSSRFQRLAALAGFSLPHPQPTSAFLEPRPPLSSLHLTRVPCGLPMGSPLNCAVRVSAWGGVRSAGRSTRASLGTQTRPAEHRRDALLAWRGNRRRATLCFERQTCKEPMENLQEPRNIETLLEHLKDQGKHKETLLACPFSH